MPTQETQVDSIANTIINLTSAVDGIRQQINAVSAAYTNLSAATKLNNFPTAPLTTTGGLGTADASPVVTNPIDTRTVIGGGISRAVSANNLAGMMTGLQGIATVINGGSVAANGAWQQLVALTL